MAKPQKHVFVCVQRRPEGHPRGSCMAHRSDEVLNEFLMEIQSRNLFEKFAVTSTGCMGPCGQGPTVLVYPEGVLYGKVGRGDVKEIVERHLLGDQPVTRLQAPADVWG